MRPVPGSAPVNSNFTVSDLIGVGEAFFLFPLFTLVPGYVIGWLVDACGFRRRSLLARLALSVALSFGVSPILAYLSWRWSILAMWTVFGVVWLCFAGLVLRQRHMWFARPAISGRRAALLGIVAGWIVLGTFSLIDLQFQDKLYFSLEVAHDYSFRSAVAASIARTGIPPVNPFFFPGRSFPLRYHYFWPILCSLVSLIGGTHISPRQAVMAGTLWSGIGLIAVIPLYLRFFQPKGPRNLDRRMLIGVGLLAVTGLNIVLVAVADVFAKNLVLTNTATLAWATGVLWGPHQSAAMVACLTAFLLLWHRRDSPDLRGDALTCTVSGMMFAGGVGLSVYVAFVFAAFSAIWIIFDCFRARYREAGLICTAGAAALVLCLPYLHELLAAGQSASGGPVLQFAVRPFFVTDAFLAGFHVAQGGAIAVADALSLPLNYLVDFGFFAAAGFLQWKRMRASGKFLDHPEICGFVLAATSILLSSFVRSGVIAYNDFGARGIMAAQFVLLIWGAEILDDGLVSGRSSTAGARNSAVALPRDGKYLLVAMLVLGVAGTLNDLCVSRFLPILADGTGMPRIEWLASDHNLGSRTYLLRQLYEGLKSKLPQTAVVQRNPDEDPGDVPYGLYADRQAAVETAQCFTVFGGDPALCSPIFGRIHDLFDKPEAFGTDRLETVCTDLSIDALVVKDTDPVWADRNSWVWKRQPAIANRYARVFLCGRSLAARP